MTAEHCPDRPRRLGEYQNWSNAPTKKVVPLCAHTASLPTQVLVYSATKMGWITRLGQYVNEFCSTTPLDSTMIDGTADLMHFRTCAPSLLYCVESAPANKSIAATSSRQDVGNNACTSGQPWRFVVVGNQKGGTTTLTSRMRSHPAVCTRPEFRVRSLLRQREQSPICSATLSWPADLTPAEAAAPHHDDPASCAP